MIPERGGADLWDAEGTSRILRRAFAINANSEWTKDSVAERCPEASASSVVHYGGPAGEEETAVPAPAVPQPYILCTARLAEYKGLDVLVMAFAELAEEDRGIHLVLCGADHSDGKLQNFVRKLGLEGRVHWLGQRSHAEARALLRECLFFVLPSRRESQGGALIEALRAGKAVAATRTGGIPEFVRDGVDGLLVEPKDVKALSAALKRLLADPGLRERLGRSARERGREFTWDKALAQYEAVYETHPSGSAKTAFVVWEESSDATARAYLENVARGFKGKDRSFVLCARRSAWSEPFQEATGGAPLYRVGLPGGRSPLDAGVVAAQLLWISRAENVDVWHYLLLRYKSLRGLAWFTALARQRPVVTLS